VHVVRDHTERIPWTFGARLELRGLLTHCAMIAPLG
jgi:hypothetical protein